MTPIHHVIQIKLPNIFNSNLPGGEKQKQAWIKLRDMSKIKAFVQIALGPTLPWGVRNVYLGSGLGGMKPNITVLGFYDFKSMGLHYLYYLVMIATKSLSDNYPLIH